MKSTLVAGRRYCARFYVNITNASTYAIDGFGAYFGDNTIDTITKCTLPLIYLTPQVKNPNFNFITDTLNWVPITGTFVANGTEKYMVIGNFNPNDIDTLLINPTNLPTIFTDAFIDDASCIDIDLPAYAGPDKTIFADDSVYIGRENDLAVDPYCIWYQVPDMINAIDTTSGLWVKPVTTTTYVVKQQIYCGAVQWDTVVVHLDAVGIKSFEKIKDQLKVYPSPAQDQLYINSADPSLNFDLVEIMNSQGQIAYESGIDLKNGKVILDLKELKVGYYILMLTNKQSGLFVSEKLVIAR